MTDASIVFGVNAPEHARQTWTDSGTAPSEDEGALVAARSLARDPAGAA
jgi:hypothetical protein